jgi:hypothetical protein
VAAVDASSGVLLPWNPNANRPVYALAVAGGTVYVGGDFPTLDGEAAHGYAGAVDAATGAIVDAFRGRVRYTVHALAATADGVYAAGTAPAATWWLDPDRRDQVPDGADRRRRRP